MKWKFFFGWLGAVVAWSLLLFCYHYLGARLGGSTIPWMAPMINELSGGLSAGLAFFAVRWLVRRWPLGRRHWLHRLPLYGLAAMLVAVAVTTSMWGMRAVAYPLAGLGVFDYGEMPLRYFMELPMELIGFTIMVVVLHGVASLRAARERELRSAQLQTHLARAQLHNLRLQLQPHFLFNALNTISSTVYEDPRAADEMIEALADLLRASLRTARTDEVPLREELAILDRYLALQRARFGDRLRVTTDLEPGTAEARVPSLLLQPLVENAVRHGKAAREGEGTIILRARRTEDRLVLEVEDDGPGASQEEIEGGEGLGLATTRERLRLLHGDGQSFAAETLPEGGFRVRLTLPFQTPSQAGEVAP